MLRTDRLRPVQRWRPEVLHLLHLLDLLRRFHAVHGVGALVEDLPLVAGDLGLGLDALRAEYLERLRELLAAEVAVVGEARGGEHLGVAAGLALVVADRLGGGDLGVGEALLGELGAGFEGRLLRVLLDFLVEDGDVLDDCADVGEFGRLVGEVLEVVLVVAELVLDFWVRAGYFCRARRCRSLHSGRVCFDFPWSRLFCTAWWF